MTRLALQMAVVTMILAGCGIVLSMPATPRAQLRPTFACPHHLSGVFGDVGDGDSKTVVVRGATMTITPHEAPTEHWKVEVTFRPTHPRDAHRHAVTRTHVARARVPGLSQQRSRL